MSVFPIKILPATDGSEEAELASTTAADLAKSTNSKLEVIYVLNVEPWRFPKEDQGAGLIVIGSRGREGIRRALMGSVSDTVIRHAHCPVMVVRPEKG